MKGLVWFREDLRVRDNLALYHASKDCAEGIMGIYIFDPSLYKKHHVADCRIQFNLCGLRELNKNLNKLGIPLLIKTVRHTSAIPKLIGLCMKKNKLDSLFYNRQYEFNESQRDKLVCNYLKKTSFSYHSYDDQLILEPGTVLTKSGNYFSIFTPFKRAWIRKLLSDKKHLKLRPIPKKQKTIFINANAISKPIDTCTPSINWPSGENEARRRLKKFIKNNILNYHNDRDFPVLLGTSQLSPYLSAGMISPRQCFLTALITNNFELEYGYKGAITWMNELIWREFYKHLLVAIPRLSMNKPYRLNTEKLKWNFDKKKLLAWQQGKTGYPIVDAGMRQLNQIGWMHNRLRMIVAMFFTKNLFFDWRIGEDYFMRHLIDGDLAANNGGWQWSASTGTDAVPYFRIFNPILQSERFDPNGDFIRIYCPELKEFDSVVIHDPHIRAPELAKLCGYPLPIVNINASRRSTLEAFKKLQSL